MFNQDKFDKLKTTTHNQLLLWKRSRGFAPDEVADRLDVAMLEWLDDLTKTLQIWIDKGENMSDGELILARTNLGSVVESWLKFFYTVYYGDYLKAPLTKNNGKMIDPKDMSFEQLKDFSVGKLWDDKQSDMYTFVDSVQHKRNAIHAFNKRSIGTASDYLDDVDRLCNFIDGLINQLPFIEDYIEVYPAGYISDSDIGTDIHQF